ncbi:MAG TPA: AMP-binding protein [Microthrixaceae bacterium]|nr:AMP-binding protein [Microthrixaceae bacterium]
MSSPVRLRPTWAHDERADYPALADQPSIEARFEEVALAPSIVERVVVVDGEVRLSGGEMLDRVRRVAGGLRTRGVQRGDVVAFQVPSWWETIALYRACWRLGAIAAPIHHLAAEADVTTMLDAVEPRLVLAAPDTPAAGHDALEVRGDGGFEGLLECQPVKTIDASPGDLSVVLFTSGSTGGPKGVLHTHRALAYKASSLLGVHGIDEHDTVLMPAPMAHISGLSNAVMLPGSGGLTSVLMDRWVPERAVDLVRDEGVTFMMGPPTFFQTMMATANFTPEAMATLRLISCGGAGVTAAFVAEASERFGAVVKRTYGSTEAPVVTTWHAGDPPEHAGDCDGRAAGAIRMRTVDPATGADVAGGEPGELWLRGPELFVGYTDPGRTADAVVGDWFRTGDLATIDRDGWLRIVGRIKDIIIRGGENISAAEVEGVLEAHAAVRQAVAVGYPDDRLGERVCAFVVLADGDGFDLDECRQWFEARGITKFKWPERVEVVDEMPVLASSGKADRAALRRSLAAGH